MESFFVTVPSNVKDFYNLNTTTNFITKLPRCLHLNDDWEVGIAEISFPKTWFNLFNPQKIMSYTNDENFIFDENTYVIKPGNYPNPNKLVENINNILKLQCYELKEDKGYLKVSPPKLIYDEYQNKISEQVGEVLKKGEKEGEGSIFVRSCIENELADMLGLSDQTSSIFGGYKMKIPHKLLSQCKSIKDRSNVDTAVDLNAGRHAIYVYSDIVQHSIVGDSHSRLLRVLQVPKKEFGDSINISFSKIFYHNLSKFEIDSIEIDLKDGTGEPIKFQYGNVIVILHFKRKNGV